MIVAELVDLCQLKCALCWNRNRRGSGKQMSLQTVEKILNRYGDVKNQTIAWFNWGEPLLYKEFVPFTKMIKGTRSCLSSNFSLHIPDSYFDGMYSFETIYVSLSGLTPEIYGIYNVGGNFKLVMENIKRVSENRYRRVVLRWQEHRYNKQFHQQAAEFAASMGFQFESIGLNCEVEELMEGFDHELLREPKFRGKSRGKECRLLYWTVIDVDGNHLLCCTSHNVPIGYHLDDNPTRRMLKRARMNTPMCQKCQELGYWRMF